MCNRLVASLRPLTTKLQCCHCWLSSIKHPLAPLSAYLYIPLTFSIGTGTQQQALLDTQLPTSTRHQAFQPPFKLLNSNVTCHQQHLLQSHQTTKMSTEKIPEAPPVIVVSPPPPASSDSDENSSYSSSTSNQGGTSGGLTVTTAGYGGSGGGNDST